MAILLNNSYTECVHETIKIVYTQKNMLVIADKTYFVTSQIHND